LDDKLSLKWAWFWSRDQFYIGATVISGTIEATVVKSATYVSRIKLG